MEYQMMRIKNFCFYVKYFILVTSEEHDARLYSASFGAHEVKEDRTERTGISASRVVFLNRLADGVLKLSHIVLVDGALGFIGKTNAELAELVPPEIRYRYDEEAVKILKRRGKS